MTHILFVLLFAGNHLWGYNDINQTINPASVNNPALSERPVSDTLLVDIQNKIYNAFVKGRMSQTNAALNELSAALEGLNKTKNQSLIIYWRSYLQFFSSINYLSKNDSKSAETEIGKGIEMIKSVEKKNSEDFTLLAMLQSFSIQFDVSQAMLISEDLNNNLKNAISLDSTNLRAWYVLASNDFYTPEQYGGGRSAEKYLLKAISLPTQKIENVYLPSWGKEESYELLIRFYIKKEKWDLAKKYFQEGFSLYPKSYTIKQLESKLTAK